MESRFGATPEEVDALGRVVAEIPEIQATLVRNHSGLTRPDRAAHQQQLAGARAVLNVARALPAELDGLGLFTSGATANGIGRISTGLGCPHLETDPDFLGLMLAFATPAGERIDFLGINDPAAPTRTPEEFVALLAATAHSAGTEIAFGGAGSLDLGNLTAAQARLFGALRERLGFAHAVRIFLHVARQTARTAFSSSAIQPYWTGVVEAGNVPGKFTFVPARDVNEHRALSPGARHLSEDWSRRLAEVDIVFAMRWIPWIDEQATPLEATDRAWSEDHAVTVGTVTFPRTDPDARDAKLISMLAGAMGANPGHWIATRPGEPRRAFAGTRFTAARQLAYALSQRTRAALPDHLLASFFRDGSVDDALAEQLARRFDEREHATPLPPVAP